MVISPQTKIKIEKIGFISFSWYKLSKKLDQDRGLVTYFISDKLVYVGKAPIVDCIDKVYLGEERGYFDIFNFYW